MSNHSSDQNIDSNTDGSQNQGQDEGVTAEQAAENGTVKTDGSTDDSAGNPGATAGIDIETALGKMHAAEQEAEQSRNDLLRVQAEMQNLRRRTEQDVEKAHKYGQEKFASELLVIIDNLERALDAARDHEDERVKAIYDGVNLTLKSFSDLFSKFNIEPIDPLGEPFDPQLHQAMSTQENAEVEPNTVTAVMQKGYMLHGRVLRPAMVMVSKAPAG
ncbi:MAG: hypothetical protein PsegKO_08150 [Pseudohongiellaceae bacterium]